MKVGDLVLIRKDEQWGFNCNQLALVVKKNKAKKTWHRLYKLMLQDGSIFTAGHDMLDIQVVSVCDSEKSYLKRV